MIIVITFWRFFVKLENINILFILVTSFGHYFRGFEFRPKCILHQLYTLVCVIILRPYGMLFGLLPLSLKSEFDLDDCLLFWTNLFSENLEFGLIGLALSLVALLLVVTHAQSFDLQCVVFFLKVCDFSLKSSNLRCWYLNPGLSHFLCYLWIHFLVYLFF